MAMSGCSATWNSSSVVSIICGQGETVRKVKHSSVRIENPLSALYRGTEYFSLARTFRTAWGGKNKSSVVTGKTSSAHDWPAGAFGAA